MDRDENFMDLIVIQNVYIEDGSFLVKDNNFLCVKASIKDKTCSLHF